MKKITLPLTDNVIDSLQAGEGVLLSGTILTGRDCAHKRICEFLDQGTPLPFSFVGETIYYAGPCPAPAGKACGSCGPTTSARRFEIEDFPCIVAIDCRGNSVYKK